MTAKDTKAAKPADTTAPVVEQPVAAVTTEYVVKDQEKYDTFRRLAGKRLGNALEKMELIANCANRNQYEYSPEQVEKIRNALQTKLDFVMNRFAPKAKATNNCFEL